MHTVWEYLILGYLISFGIQIFYYLFFYSRVSFSKIKQGKGRPQPVSVIICARDEAENLKNNLPSILEQDYPDFEVVVVNDCSMDQTGPILDSYLEKYNHLKITTIKKDPKFSHGKKLALTIGIKAASHEWLLLTDADCKPDSNQWIRSVQKNFSKHTSVVLGYGGYRREKTLLNNYIRFETFYIGLQYFGFAMRGVPYMGVGRNLAYRKSVFFKNKGFAAHYKLLSGDDDLFIGEIARKNNTRVVFTPPSLVRARAKTTLKDWIHQKRRHLTTGWRYRSSVKWLLGGELFSRISFYLILIFLLCSKHYEITTLVIFVVRALTMGMIFKLAMNHLKEKNLLLPSFYYDAINPVIHFLLTIYNLFSSEKPKWK